MEKLIVKNFGPIKEAEIDLTKYVVFIGDTSTGKSVLAKLIAIFRDINQLTREKKYFKNLKDSLKNFNIDFLSFDSSIKYFSGDFEINISNLKMEISADMNIKLDNSSVEETLKIGEKILVDFKEIEENDTITDVDKLKIRELKVNLLEAYDKLLNLNEEIRIINNDLTIYIPAERIIYSLLSDSISGLLANNVALPNCYKIFASRFEIARKDIQYKKYFDFNYSFKNSVNQIEFGGNKINLNQASSGIQSLLPLLLVLENELNKKSKIPKVFVIEEPELNLFPKRQKMLIDYLITNLKKYNDIVVITTHSPYILSALDTLMLAKNTFNEHPDLKEEINAIVSEDKWIDYDDISVYEVRNDGKVYSIKNEEFRSIDTNAIDSVSDIISKEFDKLTELRYAH